MKYGKYLIVLALIIVLAGASYKWYEYAHRPTKQERCLSYCKRYVVEPLSSTFCQLGCVGCFDNDIVIDNQDCRDIDKALEGYNP